MHNPMLDLYQAQLEASRNIANIILTNTEKMDHLALSAAKTGVGDQLKYARALGAARDAEGLKTLQSAFAQQSPEAMLGYCRDLFKVFVDTNAEIGKVAESYLEDMKAVAIKTGNGAARDMSVASSATEPVTPSVNFLNLWTNAYQQFADLTKQYMRAAEQTTTKAASALEEVSHDLVKPKARAKPRSVRR
jgi:phasin family protein